MTKTTVDSMFLSPNNNNNSPKNPHYHNLELQLSTTSVSPKKDNNHFSTQLHLSILSSHIGEKTECTNKDVDDGSKKPDFVVAARLKETAREQLKLAMAEKVFAEEARQQAKRQIELAEQEFSKAKRIRVQAQAEVEKAQALKDHAIKQINSTILQITCHACKQHFQARTPPEENSLVGSYISSAITDQGEVENDDTVIRTKASTTNK